MGRRFAPLVLAAASVACIEEFEQDDLYGRGFEMWARAEVSRPAAPAR